MAKQKELIVITGASSGIGAATAKTFAAAGHPLLLLARRLDRLQALELPNCICEQVDITDHEALKSALEKAENQYGPTGCLVNNAGIMLLEQVQNQNPTEWQKMFDVNVIGLLNGMQSVLQSMLERQTGTIINVSSIAGRKTFPNHAAYCGTKFAVHAITENVREEVSGSNVRCITIAPGVVGTELLGHTSSQQIKDDYEAWRDDMGEALQPSDVARSIMFAYMQPQSVCIREIVIAPTKQAP